MATSLVSTGLKFPDDTIQTTAATAGGGNIEAVASGALANGDKVVINTDGTVSVVAAVTQAVGTPTVFEPLSTTYTASTYDAVNNKVVIAYRNQGNSNRGTAIVGTVSGTSISFGTPVVFETGGTIFIAATYDSTNNKIVIAYRDDGNSSYGTAIVGTISGTSISFGTAVVFESAITNATSITYDSNQQKVVIAYQDNSNSSYGTAIVGTVSGTSISFGTAVVFENSNTASISITYDSTNQKVVISYRDAGNAGYGTAIVGTVSGTSISFGTAVEFESASTNYTSITYDSTNNKVVIAYQDAGNSSYGTAIVGTVSGTSISFGTPAVFESAGTEYISSSYDINAQKVVVVYRDGGNSDQGTAIVGTVSETSISFGTAIVYDNTGSAAEFSSAYDSFNKKVVIAYERGNVGKSVVFQNASANLTSENYIGISGGAYSNTDTATIQVAGAVDDAQTGLTAGQSYYVQPDGTINTTPGNPVVFAGTAVSSTKLIIKG